MKVVLKVTVYDRISADIQKAHHDRRVVDYVVVSQQEYDELRVDDRSYGALESPYMRFTPNHDIAADATMRVYTFERTTPRTTAAGRNAIQVVSYETFMGKPLVVVPKEFLPR